jgi:hypothetical protein
MSTMRTVTAAAMLCLAGGCMSVSATKSPNANLAQYHTFAFYEPTEAHPKQLAFERSPAGQVVRDRIADNLKSRGLVETPNNPDLYVAYHSKLDERTNVTDWGYRGFGGPYWGAGPGPVSIDQYTQGTLFIDAIDPRTKQVVWRGTASAVVNNPDVPNLDKLSSAVDKVMKKYPVEVAAAERPAM